MASQDQAKTNEKKNSTEAANVGTSVGNGKVVRVNPAGLPDAPTATDFIGFTPYVKALAWFLASPRTRPPLTVSVEGPWGSGKSSFLLQLVDALKELQIIASNSKKAQDSGVATVQNERAPSFTSYVVSFYSKVIANCETFLESIKKCKDTHVTNDTQSLITPTEFYYVTFNAWRNDKDEALWAAFALTFIKQIRSAIPLPKRLAANICLLWHRIDWTRGKWQIMQLAGFGALTILLTIIALVVPAIVTRSSTWTTLAGGGRPSQRRSMR